MDFFDLFSIGLSDAWCRFDRDKANLKGNRFLFRLGVCLILN